MKFAFVFPARARNPSACWTRFGDHPAVRDASTKHRHALGAGLWRADQRGPEGSAQPDDQHPAGDADGGLSPLSRLARAGGAPPDVVAGHSSGRIHRAGRRRRADASRTRCRWCAFARRRCRKRCRSARARWRRSWASTTRPCATAARGRAAGEVVEAVNFNAPEPGRDRRHTRRPSSAPASCEGARREARAAAAGSRRRSIRA